MGRADGWPHIIKLLLLAHWGKETAQMLTLITGKSLQSNSVAARQMGLPTSFRRKFSRRADDLIIANYKTVTNIDLARMLNEMWPQCFGEKLDGKAVQQHLMHRLKLRRTKAEVAELKRSNQLRSWRNGVYDTVVMACLKPIGAFALRDLGVRKVLFHKLENGQWVRYPRYLYELHFGPIPKGYCVGLIDENPENVVVENLRLYRKTEKSSESARQLTDIYLLKRIFGPDYQEMIEELPEEYIQSLITLKRLQLTSKRKRHEQKSNKLERDSSQDG